MKGFSAPGLLRYKVVARHARQSMLPCRFHCCALSTLTLPGPIHLRCIHETIQGNVVLANRPVLEERATVRVLSYMSLHRGLDTKSVMKRSSMPRYFIEGVDAVIVVFSRIAPPPFFSAWLVKT